MSYRLPPYNGREIDQSKLSFTGSITEDEMQPSHPIQMGDHVYMIVHGICTGVGHDIKVTDQEEVVTRNPKIKILEAHAVRDGMEAGDLIGKYRQLTLDELDKFEAENELKLGGGGTADDADETDEDYE